MDVMEEKDVYLADFARFERERGVEAYPGLQRLRAEAAGRFADLGFPTTDDEEWRFTNLAPLLKVPFQLAAREPSPRGVRELLPPADPQAHVLVFVNGHYDPDLSSHGGLPAGVALASLATVLQRQPQRAEPHLGRYAAFDQHAFVALNTAFVRDGAFLEVPRGVMVEKPIHLVYVSTVRDEPTVSHPRTLLIAGENSRATVVETYVGFEDEVYFTNAVTEVVVGPGAALDHYKVQRESREAFHVATMQVQHARASRFASHSIALGGGLVRNDVNAYLGAEHCESTLNGLYLASGEQLIDNHTRIDHAQPHCASHELYKGILDGKARGVFNGKIFVHQDAQKTDAKQTNKTLLLSEDAVIDTKPQLEIFADDVKCTHGATIGQLDADQVFYLRARGVGLEEARNLLTYAFANDIIGRIQVASVREQLEAYLLERQHLPRTE